MLGIQEPTWLTNPKSNLVFHYTSYEVLQKILSSGKIRFGSMSRSNDIYERLLHGIEPSVWGGTENEAYGSIKAAVLIQKKLHIRCKTFCTVNDNANSHHLGRGYMNYTLWWHYANSNKGVCIALNKRKLCESFDEAVKANQSLYFKYDDISYDLSDCDLLPLFNPTIPLTCNTRIMTEHLLKHVRRFEKFVFFTKDSSWNTENEFRFAVINKNSKPFDVDVTSAMTGLVIGYKFPDSEISLLQQALSQFGNMPCAWIDFWDGKPHLYALPEHP